MEFIPERALLSTTQTIRDLASLLATKLLSTVERSEVLNLHSSLVSLRLYFNGDTSVNPGRFTPLQSWLEQIKLASDLAEGVTSAYTLRALKRRSQRGFANFFDLSEISISVQSCDLASDVRKIENSVLEILNNHPRQRPSRWFDIPSLDLVREADLIQSLTGGESGLSMISIVGAAGAANDLATIVFHDEAVTRHFDVCSWIIVGRWTRAEDALKAIRREYLKSKRYVIVFDDVWSEEFSGALKHFLPENNNGSRTIVTTCNETIAAACDDIYRLPLSKPLGMFEEWIGIWEGVPFVMVPGMSQKSKRTMEEQCRVVLSAQKTIACGLDDLSYPLKLCFMYLSVFPRDSMIPYDKLFRLWIAEGFVEDEEHAEEHLDELVSRDFVQACEGFYGLERFCQVSVLMHEMAREEAIKLGFCAVICDETDSHFDPKVARISISCVPEREILYNYNKARIRSVFLFDLPAPPSKSFQAAVCKEFKLLTTFVFENVPIEDLPDEVGNLIFLKHLSVKNTLVKKLPRSIKNLTGLETLDARNTLLTELPVEIYKLQNLQHLLASTYEDKIRLYSSRGVKVRPGMLKLKNLQTLLTIEENFGLLKELASLSKLRRLGISRMTVLDSSALCQSIKKMTALVRLTLHLRNGRESLDLQSIVTPPPLLEHLILKGRLSNFPIWVSSLRNLTMVCFSFSGLVDDPLAHFSLLPNLASLWLYRSFEGNRLCFEGGGFRALRLLVLRELPELEAVEIEDGALPNLEELRIGPSPQLEELPAGIRGLSRLKSLALYDMPNKFVLDLQPDGGSEYGKVDRIPSVQFWYRVKGRQYVWYELGQWGLADHLQGDSISQREQSHHLSLCYSDEDTHSVASASPFRGRPSFSSDRFSKVESVASASSSFRWDNIHQPSFASDHLSFFTDDIED